MRHPHLRYYLERVLRNTGGAVSQWAAKGIRGGPKDFLRTADSKDAFKTSMDFPNTTRIISNVDRWCADHRRCASTILTKMLPTD